MSMTSRPRLTNRKRLTALIKPAYLRSSRSTSASEIPFMRCESKMMFADYLLAFRRLRSMAFLLPACGAFISQSTPPITTSGEVTR